eukprot:11160363-Lingulodinium_polyedra.AAC.1
MPSSALGPEVPSLHREVRREHATMVMMALMVTMMMATMMLVMMVMKSFSVKCPRPRVRSRPTAS